MVYLLEHLFRVVWHEEVVPKEWREGLIVNIFQKGDNEEPGNYRGITLLSVARKAFCTFMHLDREVEHCMKVRWALERIEAV